jgi:hypothetical protein
MVLLRLSQNAGWGCTINVVMAPCSWDYGWMRSRLTCLIREARPAGMALIIGVVAALVALGAVGLIAGSVASALVTGWVSVVIAVQRRPVT